MKVYVFFIEQVYETDLIRQDISVYASLSKAKEVFNKFVEDEKEFVEENDWVESEDNNSMNYEAYKDGYYCTNRTIAYIDEQYIIEDE